MKETERDAPSVEVCRWWMKNHVCMPFDWRRVAELYEKEKAKNETDK